MSNALPPADPVFLEPGQADEPEGTTSNVCETKPGVATEAPDLAGEIARFRAWVNPFDDPKYQALRRDCAAPTEEEVSLLLRQWHAEAHRKTFYPGKAAA